MHKYFSHGRAIAYSILSVAVIGCNSGSKQNDVDTSIESTNIQPQRKKETLHLIGSDNSNNRLQLGTEPDNLVIGFDNIKIGTGINPISGEIFNSSVPMKESAFFYYSGDGTANSIADGSNYYRPLEICNGFSFVSSAEELGSVKSTSSSNIFTGSAGVGINYGLAKLKTAASFEHEDINENGEVTIRKNIGAWLTCPIYSYADPKYDSGGIKAKHFGDALLNANYDVANAIAKVRKANNVVDKQNAIRDFYNNFGTHMVSSVTISDVSARTSVMSQRKDQSSSQNKGAVSANFSYGPVTGDAQFSMAMASKFDSKSWDISYTNKAFPSDTPLQNVTNDLQAQLDKMKSEGIIDYSKLQPDPAKATLPPAPDLSKITFDESSFKSYADAQNAYNSLENTIEQFNSNISLLSELPSSDSLTKVVLTELHEIQINTDIISKLGMKGLDYGQYQSFSSKLSTVSKAAKTSGLDSALSVSPIDEAKLKAAISNYNTYYMMFSNNSQKLQESMTALSKRINDFKEKYPTLKVYFTKYAAVKENIIDNVDSWVDLTMSAKDSVVYTKYRDEYYKSLDIAVSSENVLLSETEENNKTLQSSGNPFGAIYDNHAITNFNVVPWANIFPELAQTFALDDTNEVILTGIDKTIDDFEKEYAYLLFSMKMDNTSNGKLNSWFVSLNRIHKDVKSLELNIISARANNDPLAQVAFNGNFYDINSIDSSAQLNDALKNYIEHSSIYQDTEFKNWDNAHNILKGYYLLGNVGAIPAYSVHDGFARGSTHENKYNQVIPMVKEVSPIKYDNNSMDDKRNPLRTILHLTSANLFNNKEVIAQSYNPYNLGVSSEEMYKDEAWNYSNNAKSNPENALSNLIPADNSSYNMMGVVPILTSSSKTIESEGYYIINNIALVDSAGNIWNINMLRTESNVDRFTDGTKLFSLQINKSTGETLVLGAKFYEYHWKFGSGKSKQYDGMLMLSHDFSDDSCWNKGVGHYTPTCVQTSKDNNTKMTSLQMWKRGDGTNTVDTYDFARVINGNNVEISTPYANTTPDWIDGNYYNAQEGLVFDHSKSYSSLKNKFFYEQFIIDSVGGNGGYYSWDEAAEEKHHNSFGNSGKYVELINKYRDLDEHIPHGLVLIPMKPDLITNIAAKINGNTAKQPMLPTYSF